MKKALFKRQGWDAQAISAIANDYYGGYANMFRSHDWPERGDSIMRAVQSRVVEAYGSVQAFEEAHERGPLMFPMEAIKSKPPNIWLTSFYGFNPEKWGQLGFSDARRRQTFLDRTKPGVLVVIYGASKAGQASDRGKIIGLLQCSHELGSAEKFMAPEVWRDKQSDPKRAGRWNFGVRATRAWRVAPESQMPVREFAPDATASGAWEHIGALGQLLTPREAQNIFKLDLQEIEVYGRPSDFDGTSRSAKEALAPSKAGPVSQTPFLTKESEGPKHLYMLVLKGDTDAFLGENAGGRVIVKPGFSGSPATRCKVYNCALPACAYRWEILHSGVASGFDPHPSSKHARAGELAMQSVLRRQPRGQSLGGEFFLADTMLIEEAWQNGNQAAKAYKL